MAGSLGGDHGDIDAARGGYEAEANVEAVGEEHRVPVGEMGGDLGLVNPRLLGVRQQDHHEVGLGGGFGHAHDTQPRRLRLGAGGGLGPQAHPHVDARVVQVQSVRVTLRAVTDDRYPPRADQGGIGVFFVIELGHDGSCRY